MPAEIHFKLRNCYNSDFLSDILDNNVAKIVILTLRLERFDQNTITVGYFSFAITQVCTLQKVDAPYVSR